NTTVVGIVSIQTEPVRVLFDSGATYSVVSSHFAKKLHIDYELLSEPLEICTPLGDTVLVCYMYLTCVIEIENRKLLVDLIELPVLEINVILGMDWLFAHHAHIDCHRKRIEFKPKGHDSFIYQGNNSDVMSRMISTMTARRLLRKGCY